MKRRQRSKSISVLMVISLMVPLLTGCWDRLEIEERAMVLGIGIDTVTDGEKPKNESFSHPSAVNMNTPKTGLIKITVQIAVPGRIPLGPGGGGGGEGGGGPKTIWVVDAVGHTVADAFNVLQQKVSQPLFFGHLRIIVVSEALALKGIQNLNDYFRRNPDVRRMNWMMICKGESASIMHSTPQLRRVPTLYLMTAMDQAVKMGRLPNVFLGIFWSASSAMGKEGYLPYVELKDDQNVEISGLAYFKSDKMVGVSGPFDTILLMGIMGIKEGGGEAYVKVPGANEYFMFQSRTRKSIIRTSIVEGKPHVDVRIVIDGNLLSKSNEIISLTRNLVKDLEKQLEKDDTKGYKAFIAKTQQLESDIFGFGEHIRAEQSSYWNEHVKTAEKWQEMYKDLKVDVSVTIRIRRIGMKAT